MEKITKEPAFKRTDDHETIVRLINQRLISQPLTVQLPQIDEKFCKIIKADEDGALINFIDMIPPNGSITISGFINEYYSELEVDVLDPIDESLFLCKPHYIRISSQRRSEPRFLVNDHDEIFVKRIKIPKNELNIKHKSIPVAYQIILEKHDHDHKDLSDEVNIKPFTDKSEIYREIAHSGGTLYIGDVNKDTSFDAHKQNNDIIDVRTFFGDQFENKRKELIIQNIIGWIICPILGPVAFDSWFPVGYIEIKSHTPLDIKKVMELKSLSLEIVKQLLELNTYENTDKHDIVDISRSGLKILVKDQDLIYAIQKHPQFTFDIIIKGQAPITFLGWVKISKKMEDGSLLIGLKIQGETDRKDQMLRYLEYVKSVEPHARQV